MIEKSYTIDIWILMGSVYQSLTLVLGHCILYDDRAIHVTLIEMFEISNYMHMYEERLKEAERSTKYP